MHFLCIAETFFTVPLKCSHFTLLHTDVSQLAPLSALRITWSIPAAKATLCWKDGRCCCDVCFQKNCSPRFPLIECRCSSNSKLPANHRFAERIVWLAQQHDVAGLRTQFFTQCACTVRNQVQTGGGQSTLSQPCTHRYQKRNPQTTENRHVQVCVLCSLQAARILLKEYGHAHHSLATQ